MIANTMVFKRLLVNSSRESKKQTKPAGRQCVAPVLKAVLPIVVFGILIWPSFGLAPLYAANAVSVSRDSMMEKVQPSDEVTAILKAFPAGSIDSVEKADQVLDIVDIEKRNVEARLFNQKLDCNKRFLVYKCYDEALEVKRVDLKELHALEVEAKRFRRSEDVRQRDLALDRRKADEAADAPKRAENVKAHEDRVKRVQQREAERAAAARGVTSTPKERHSGNLMTSQEKAANVQKYEEKVRTSEERKKIVEQKKAETQSKRDKKAAEDAAKAEAERKKAQPQTTR